MAYQTIGIIGLGVMGRNLTLNIAHHGFSSAGFDVDMEKTKAALQSFAGCSITVSETLESFVNDLESPKKILMMVPAGKAVDDVIKNLSEYMSEGDILIDGGNSHFLDTERRTIELESRGIFYIGTGISGGEEGALLGPSIMPGGNPKAWPFVKDILKAIAAKVDGDIPCCEWIGSGGAGHFVKMVHNGIEYADMQMICEAYFLMEKVLGLSPDEMHEIFTVWNKGELASYLIEITGAIMARNDPQTGKPIIHIILDTAGQKGTGKWMSQTALDLGIPAPTIAEAVFARTLSALKDERVKASHTLKGPRTVFKGDKNAAVEMIRKTLYASKICSYAQGFHLMKAASDEYSWNLNLGAIALLWRAGCIIRAQFLGRIKEAFDKNPALSNLLLDPHFKSVIERNQDAWRNAVAMAVKQGVPIPAFSSALSYYDSYRSERLPANLLQAQRDYFGAHTYERVDKPRGQFFHTEWVHTDTR